MLSDLSQTRRQCGTHLEHLFEVHAYRARSGRRYSTDMAMSSRLARMKCQKRVVEFMDKDFPLTRVASPIIAARIAALAARRRSAAIPGNKVRSLTSWSLPFPESRQFQRKSVKAFRPFSGRGGSVNY